MTLGYRWKHLHRVLKEKGPFSDADWNPSDPSTLESLESSKILVIGAGGLGCEILKNLALSGVKDIHVIDMDTIDISNLNRQFLFRQSDVGKSKAEVAARFVERRVKSVRITPHVCKIQDKDEDFYMQFKIIVCGLDSIEARRWINSTLCSMVDGDNPESLKPFIDGGTEGFKGQARVILPTLSSCFECQLDMHAHRPAVPLCTIATIPRQPQHCIEWAHQIAWPAERSGEAFDGDDMEHVSWIYHKALQRAKEFSIPGVTFSMSQGVVKNIIPAIASTNAIIAAACTSETFKILTSSNPYLDSYMMYAGEEGIYTFTFQPEQKSDCPVCGNLAKPLTVKLNSTLEQFIELLGDQPEAQLKKPSLRTEQKTLYQRFPAQIEEATRSNLAKPLQEIVADGEEVAVTDPAFAIVFRFKVVYEKAN